MKMTTFENTYMEEPQDFLSDDGDAFASITIDGYPDIEEGDEGQVIAVVECTLHGDIVIFWKQREYSCNETVKNLIAESIQTLKEMYAERKAQHAEKNGWTLDDLKERVCTEFEKTLCDLQSLPAMKLIEYSGKIQALKEVESAFENGVYDNITQDTINKFMNSEENICHLFADALVTYTELTGWTSSDDLYSMLDDAVSNLEEVK